MALLVAVAALVLDAGWDLFNPALGVCLGLLPLATGAAILRYRLYDLDTLTGELLAVVEQTMQPTRASLWLRPSSRG
jgi:hypothetical protein